MIKIDTLLHDAVERSIDRTIEYVGRALVDSKVKEFMDAKAVLDKKCPVVTICNADGKFVPENERTKCVKEDVGCGYECIQEHFPYDE